MATKAKERKMNWSSLKSQFKKALSAESTEVANAVLHLMEKVHERYPDHQVILAGDPQNHSWRPVVVSEDGVFQNVCPHCLTKYFHLEGRNEIEDSEISGSAPSIEDIEYDICHEQRHYCVECNEDLYSYESYESFCSYSFDEFYGYFEDKWGEEEIPVSLEQLSVIDNDDVYYDGAFELERPAHWVTSNEVFSPKSLNEVDDCLWLRLEYVIDIDISEVPIELSGVRAVGLTDGVKLSDLTPEWLIPFLVEGETDES